MWRRAQSRFETRFATDASKLASRPVYVRWYTGSGAPTTNRWGTNLPRWQDLTQLQILGLAAGAILTVYWLMEVVAVPLPLRLLVVLAVAAALALWARGGDASDAGHRYVAVWRPDALMRTPPMLVFEVDRASFGRTPSGAGPAMLFGAPAPNGALCIVVEGIAVKPIAPPVRRFPDAPGR
jgi:hypothetical protein